MMSRMTKKYFEQNEIRNGGIFTMTKSKARELHENIANVLNPVKEKDGLIIMAFTYANAHGLYVLDGIARQVLYSGKEEYDISIYIENLLAKDYFAAKASLGAIEKK